MDSMMYAQDPWGIAPLAGLLGLSIGTVTVLLIGFMLWALVWKAFALWHAARNRQKGWFIALLIINTAGLLEIAYLLWFKKDRNQAGSASWFPPKESSGEGAV